MYEESERRGIYTALIAATVVLLAWGAFAFGAVYVWAYTTLAILAAATGVTSLFVTRHGPPRLRTLAVALASVGIAILFQLVPLPRTAVDSMSPKARGLVEQYEASYSVLRPLDESVSAAPAASPAPLSIAPAKTTTGLLLFAAFAVLCLGTARLISVTGGLTLTRPLLAVGIVLALVGVGQSALTGHEQTPLIYGFWKPQYGSRPFGPFVNPNHFAGWMLMVLPLCLALFYEALQRAIETARRHKQAMSFASTPELGRALTFGFSAIVLALSLIMTLSRSAMAALAVTSLLAMVMMLKRQQSARARIAVVLSFLVLLVVASSWAGLDIIITKSLADRSGGSLGGRVGAWRDTLRIIQDFPVTGTGFDTYGRAMTIYQTGSRTVHFQEAHNDYLQLAAEGGLLVGIPILATLGIFVRDVWRRFREAPKQGTTYWLRIGAVLGLIAIGLQSLMDFSLQMPGNAALFAVLCGIAVHQSPNLRRGSARIEDASRRTEAPGYGPF